MTLNSISLNFQWISRDFADFGRNSMKIGQYCRDNVVGTSNWNNFDRLSRRAGLSATAGLSCITCILAKETLKSTIFTHFRPPWPWPSPWPWIRSYGIPSCITHRPLSKDQIPFKSENVVDWQTDIIRSTRRSRTNELSKIYCCIILVCACTL